MSSIPCPVCGDVDTCYAPFSGGNEMYCPSCRDNFIVTDELVAQLPPRVKLLRDGKFDELMADLHEELDRRSAEEDET